MFLCRKSRASFNALREHAEKISDLDIQVRHGEFESLIPEISKFIGTSFSLIFVDPKGWTGFGLDKIKPLLELKGEVLVNFMYDHINRHLEDHRSAVIRSIDPLFGGEGWLEDIEKRMAQGMSREDAVVETYRERFKETGSFPLATTTRILKPLADRTYYYLVYGTRH